MRNPLPLPLAVTVALGLVVPALPATAQATDAATQLDAVVVTTGSRARARTVVNSAVPIDVFTQDDLRRAGVIGGELGQALGQLLPSFNFPRQSNSGGSDHIRAAQLRGLSPDQVLVLINGKRRHTSAVVNLGTKIGKGTAPVDFNSIPLSAVKRIEVLRDGAGAQYGSDAIAGVINVILDDAPAGGRASISYGAHHTDVEPIDRTLTDGQTTTADASIGFALDGDGFLRLGAEVKDRAQNNRAGLDQIPFFEAQTPANLAQAGQVNYRIGDPETEDATLWLNGARGLGEAELYAFAIANQRDTLGAAFFRYPDGRSNVPQIYPEGFRPDTTGDNQDLSAVLGLRGLHGAWDYDFSIGWGSNRFDYGLRNSLNASLGLTSPTTFDLAGYRLDQAIANADLRRDLDVAGWYSPLTLAVGAELRSERFEVSPGDPASYAVGPFTDRAPGAQAGPGLTPDDRASTSRDSRSAYVDLSADVTERLFLNGAARYDHYNDVGGELTGKLSGRFALNETWALRGAVSNNLRAPSLAQESYQDTGNDFGEGGQVRVVRTLSVNNPIARALGARRLDPETSVNASLGLTAELGAGFTVALDVFQVRIDDRITLSERIAGDEVSDFIQQNFGLAGVDGVNFFTNAVDTKTRGADLVVSWRGAAAGGSLGINASYGYARTEIEHIDPTPPELLALGVDNVIFGVEENNTLTSAAPRQKAVIGADWSGTRWDLNGRLTRHGATTRVFNFGGGFIPTQTYDARYQLDLEAGYRISASLRIAVGANNLLDEYPERSNADIFYFGNLPYDVLSGIGVNGAFYYGRLEYRF
jgi:iron complex outermembrane recepter protein